MLNFKKKLLYTIIFIILFSNTTFATSNWSGNIMSGIGIHKTNQIFSEPTHLSPALKVSADFKHKNWPFSLYSSYSSYRIEKDLADQIVALPIYLIFPKPINSIRINSDLRIGIRKYYMIKNSLPLDNIHVGLGAIFLNAKSRIKESLLSSKTLSENSKYTQGVYLEIGSSLKFYSLILGYSLSYSFINLKFKHNNTYTKINPSELSFDLHIGYRW